ncbi:hypothetical protein BLNAU_590 [Blattamonas nauphoetae]|uniref:Uncharacterized protein n=1 Tax=Blattamonas nauphoetae TaxID=2049346 RepID=A0ABQ9YLP8_9EUKA|nr:hypothetical protein BLNAU_590 [Blattamonas nauphoetae]
MDTEEILTTFLENVENDEIEELDPQLFNRVVSWAESFPPLPPPLPNLVARSLYSLITLGVDDDSLTNRLKTEALFDFLKDIIENERDDISALSAAMNVASFIFGEKLLIDGFVRKYIIKSFDDTKSTELEQVKSELFPIMDIFMNFIEVEQDEIREAAARCLMTSTLLFQPGQIDPILPHIFKHDCFRTFLDTILHFCQDGIAYSAEFLLHCLSVPGICRKMCFGNSLVSFMDILLIGIEHMDPNDEEAFVLLMCLDSFFRNSEYKYNERPLYKIDQARSLLQELNKDDYPEQTKILAGRWQLKFQDSGYNNTQDLADRAAFEF